MFVQELQSRRYNGALLPQANTSITGQVYRVSFAQHQCDPASPAERLEGI